MNYYEIEPVDTLFFRDGRPYNMSETQNDVKSEFPPSPYTLVGALRAGLARKMGWHGGPWRQELVNKLGDGSILGPLRFSGPYLQADGELVFPVPRNVLAQKEKDNKWKNFRKLRPSDEVLSDQGKIRYPVLDENLDKMKNIPGFLKYSDMQKVLWEDNISGIEPIAQEKIWKHEFNVGIQRDEEKLTVQEGGLFSRSLVRLGEGGKGSDQPNVKIVSGIEGIDEVLDAPLMLGGESKTAFIDRRDGFELPKPPDGVGKLEKFIAVLITPANIGKLIAGGGIDELPDDVKLVSVCADRPQTIGGWDFRKGPLPLRPHLRAGSVLFCKSDEGIVPEDWNGKLIGNCTEFGFGQILIGTW